jgi:hypothetical protein
MNKEQAMTLLRTHTDTEVRAATGVLDKADANRKTILNTIRAALGQLRLDLKYMAFDLEATRRERDELKA